MPFASTVTRSKDVQHINAVANHPEVFKWVSAPGMPTLDLSPLVNDDNNILLANEYGGFLFVNHGRGKYEVHTQFVPEGRKGVLRQSLHAARYMFTQTDCIKITTYVPVGNIGAKRLVEGTGFTYDGQEGEWTYFDGTTVPVDHYSLTKENWLCQ